MVEAAVTAGLLSVGCEVVDLGICPTPTLQLAVRWLGAKGGISITGGHNPPEWNALKFVRGDGLYLSAIQARGAARHLPPGGGRARGLGPRRDARRGAGRDRPPPGGARRAVRREGGAGAPAPGGRGLRQRVLRAPRSPLARGARLRGAADQRRPLAALPAAPRALGRDRGPGPGDRARGTRRPRPRARRRRRAAEPRGRDGPSPLRGADPAPRGRSRPHAAEGPDRHQRLDHGPRRARGRPARGEGGAHAGRARPSSRRRSSSTAPSSGAKATAGWPCPRSRPPTTARRRSASSSSISPARACRSRRSTRGCPLSWCASSPCPWPRGTSSPPSRSSARRSGEVEGATVDQTDGVKVLWPDGWVHVRASNTQSLVRVIAEADDAARAQELADWARERLRI